MCKSRQTLYRIILNVSRFPLHNILPKFAFHPTWCVWDLTMLMHIGILLYILLCDYTINYSFSCWFLFVQTIHQWIFSVCVSSRTFAGSFLWKVPKSDTPVSKGVFSSWLLCGSPTWSYQFPLPPAGPGSPTWFISS